MDGKFRQPMALGGLLLCGRHVLQRKIYLTPQVVHQTNFFLYAYFVTKFSNDIDYFFFESMHGYHVFPFSHRLIFEKIGFICRTLA